MQVAGEVRSWLTAVQRLDAGKVDFPEHVAELHCRFEQIHPFLDGNGRTGSPRTQSPPGPGAARLPTGDHLQEAVIPPNVLATLYPAMDGRRQVIVKANGGEVVKDMPI